MFSAFTYKLNFELFNHHGEFAIGNFDKILIKLSGDINLLEGCQMKHISNN